MRQKSGAEGESSRSLSLVCNAHLDPVWLWTWPEGLAEALATFRTAVELCGEFPDFVFCHNEAVLYRWAEEFDPELFARIRELVKEGRWHVMGGWFLQPDCNLPCGESFVRQALVGKLWFKEKFGVEPGTAVNLDSFGHSRGLVQILKKSGSRYYLFCRPDPGSLPLPGDHFLWVGYDGSEIAAYRPPDHYNSERGRARNKVENRLRSFPGTEHGILLWGIGDHGGGASREDLNSLRRLIESSGGPSICHATPDEYFSSEADRGGPVKRWTSDLNPWAVGCYTTMARIKRRHRALESRYLSVEKTAAHAAVLGTMAYPGAKLAEALEDLLFCQFHDILAGTAIAEVEDFALRRMGHGLEILDRIQTQAFFALSGGLAPARENEFPILVYNPHPFSVTDTVECEFQPPEPRAGREPPVVPVVYGENGRVVPHQVEKEACNIAVDQRKRVVFRADLPPGRMCRFSCRPEEVKKKPGPARTVERTFSVDSESVQIEIDARTGWIREYRRAGLSFLDSGGVRLLMVRDDPDPWGMKVSGFRDVVDEFRVMTAEESASFAGVERGDLPPVRVIEEGAVRTVVEVLLTCRRSDACLRYKLPRIGAELEVELRVYWNEKDRMLKLSLPTSFKDGTCLAQSAYGVNVFASSPEERTGQKWAAVLDRDLSAALTVINDGCYGFDFNQGDLRLSLLRSAAYAAHPTADEVPILRQDRFEPRIDQGERLFRFWIQGGEAGERRSRIDREAQVKHEPPPALSMNPRSGGERPEPLVYMDGEAVILSACKRAETDNRLVLRFFEPTGESRRTEIVLPIWNLRFPLELGPFEIKTLCVDPATGKVEETDLLERPLLEGDGRLDR